MPASIPGATRAQNLANPSTGQFVIFDPISGPKGSPLDGRTISGYDANRMPIYVADPTNFSTGALSTGIGIGANALISGPATPPVNIYRAGWNDNMVPGKKIATYAAAPAVAVVATDAFNSTMLYIGGGRMVAGTADDIRTGRPYVPSPYTAGVAIFGAGNGGSRDAGAGPAFTGFALKMVTAAGAVADGAVVETGFTNRSGRALVTGDSVFGSEVAATAAPAMADPPEGDAPFLRTDKPFGGSYTAPPPAEANPYGSSYSASRP